MGETRFFRCEQTIPVQPWEVYRAFTNSTSLREWLCDVAQCDPRPGGRLYLWWNSGYYSCGEFLRLEPAKTIRFAYLGRGEPGRTEVVISLEGKNGETHLQLEHGGLGEGEAWDSAYADIQRGWEISMENLASVLTTGEDIRLTRRPMLGIGLSDFNTEIAAQLGVPVSQGIRISTVLPDMGAAAAGLKENDVIVEFGGKPIAVYPDLVGSLQGRRADDELEVGYYRGNGLRRTTMQLSRRPLPPLPETTSEFAEKLEREQAGALAELEKCLEGATEEEASFHPVPGEWSVKEVLAHLIHSERGVQEWICQLAAGSEHWADDYGDNLSARNQATLAVYPTCAALLDQLKRSQKETVELIRALPPEFRQRKGSYWKMALDMLGEPSMHLREHLSQVQAAIAVARQLAQD